MGTCYGHLGGEFVKSRPGPDVSRIVRPYWHLSAAWRFGGLSATSGRGNILPFAKNLLPSGVSQGINRHLSVRRLTVHQFSFK
jgi:hypothetical protein